MTIDAILFDKDGTLFDFEATWEAWARAFLLRVTEGDQGRAAKIGHEIGFDFPQNMIRPESIVVAGTPDEIVAAMLPHLPSMTGPALMYMLNDEAASAPQIEAVPLVPFLDLLRRRGLKLGVATNDAESPALAHLRSVDIVGHFDFIAGFDSGHGAKPSPGQLHAFADAVDVSVDRIAMVGDSTHDLVAGRKAGMVTVGVLTGLAKTAELTPYADVVLPDIGHLPDWLDQRAEDTGALH